MTNLLGVKSFNVLQGRVKALYAGDDILARLVRNLSTNPMFRASTGSNLELRRNLCQQPDGAVGTGWSQYTGVGGTGTPTTFPSGGPFTGTGYRRLSFTAATTSPSGGQYHGSSATYTSPVTAGQVYTGSGFVRPSRAQNMSVQIEWKNSSNGLISRTRGAAFVTPAGAWTRIYATGTAPTGAVGVTVTFYAASTGVNWEIGDTLDVSCCQVDQFATLRPYIGGSVSDDPRFGAQWLGAVNASATILVGKLPAQQYGSSAAANGVAASTIYNGGSVVIFPSGQDSYYGFLWNNLTPGNAPMLPGKTYTVIAMLNLPVVQTGTIYYRARRIMLWDNIKDWAGEVLSIQSPNTPGVHEHRVTFTVDPAATSVRLRLYAGASSTDIEWSQLTIVEGIYEGPAFNGDTDSQEDLGVPSWLGAVDASMSEALVAH